MLFVKVRERERSGSPDQQAPEIETLGFHSWSENFSTSNTDNFAENHPTIHDVQKGRISLIDQFDTTSTSSTPAPESRGRTESRKQVGWRQRSRSKTLSSGDELDSEEEDSVVAGDRCKYGSRWDRKTPPPWNNLKRWNDW